jgi:phosphoglycerol transferase MdoB-like AlkP superfamily enzyme
MEKIKNYYKEHLNNSLTLCFIWAFALNLFIETLARHNPPVLGGLKYMVTDPIVFLDNMLIIFATLCIATIFRRRAFVMGIGIALWTAIGIANGVILMQRMTPFTVKDLSSMTDGATIMTNYLSKWQIILIIASLVAIVVGFVLLFIKGPKKPTKVNIKRNLAVCVLIIACAFGGTFGLIKINVMSTFFGNLAYAYQDYGVPYCFINTWLNTGIHRPSNYSKKAVQAVFSDSEYTGKDKTMKLNTTKTTTTKDEPNILFLQLESFVDPELFKDVKLSKDPIPYYRYLRSKYSSGSLTVPACGAGTANTEFEVMTGLSVKFFGPGEYPFKSVLKDKAAESVARDLKSLGYGTHAIHNHRAMFYNRNEVFKNLGYDSFTSLEYMSDVQKTPKGWAKDNILTSQIMDAMKSTKSKDYIYTISVQGHGKYPTEKLIANPKIKVTSAPDEETKNKYEYYVNQVYEMDKFVKNLTHTLSNYNEKVVLVMYGDHIPALDMSESSYKAKDLYQTQYVIWSNYKMTKEDKDLYAYQLSAEVLNRVGIHTGTTTIYHQDKNHSSKSYLKNLKLLGYDMLYGKDYIYGGSNPFKPSKMTMGVKKIKINKVVNVGGKYYIKGQNFTEFSKVTLDGKALKTVYLGPSLLGLLTEVDPNDASKMKVSQIDKTNDTIISTTE